MSEAPGIFGMVPICEEGGPVHPDKFDFGGTDGAYLRRLQAYADRWGIESTRNTVCSRPWLLDPLRRGRSRDVLARSRACARGL